MSCGGGDQIRQVSCVNIDLEEPGEGCDPAEQPTATQKCNTQLCPQAQHSAHGNEMPILVHVHHFHINQLINVHS